MWSRGKLVEVIQMPDCIDRQRKREFCREFEKCMNVDRPALVLDCSTLQIMDRNAVSFLLYCLEEAMKLNGDVKLAALKPDAEKALRSYHLDRVFEMFANINDALESFRFWPISPIETYPSASGAEGQTSDNVA